MVFDSLHSFAPMSVNVDFHVPRHTVDDGETTVAYFA